MAPAFAESTAVTANAAVTSVTAVAISSSRPESTACQYAIRSGACARPSCFRSRCSGSRDHHLEWRCRVVVVLNRHDREVGWRAGGRRQRPLFGIKGLDERFDDHLVKLRAGAAAKLVDGHRDALGLPVRAC